MKKLLVVLILSLFVITPFLFVRTAQAQSVTTKPVVVESYEESPTGINATDKTGQYIIKFKVDGIVRAWTKLKIHAYWKSGCVMVISATRSHWVADGWGTMKWGPGKLGASLCVTNVTRSSEDNWYSPSGYPDYVTDIVGDVSKGSPGLFIWHAWVTQK